MTFKRTSLTLTIVALAASLLFLIAFLVEGLKDRAGCGSALFPSDPAQAQPSANNYMPCEGVLLYTGNSLPTLAFGTALCAIVAGVIWMWRQQVLERAAAPATAPTPAPAAPETPVAEPIDTDTSHQQFQRPTP